ncbi:DUF397 domain-containing protein [Catenuloplanes atrovinosus]|uniref:DUF397 domain-containing protein n=1 Tax=Catenuloplanes atrovinosus TaxID=137266 RepID=UPI00286A9823|nr:DUF397 domain-containing protein [Catenuloplanes atrovinosus]
MDHLTWKKSSRSGPNGGECVEIATDKVCVYVRDSKQPGGPMLTLSSRSWLRFVHDLCSDRGSLNAAGD